MSHTKELIIIRHAESETNSSDLFQAGNQYTGDPLHERGIHAASRLATRFGNVALDAILASSYLRARQTATAIHQATGAVMYIPTIRGDVVVDEPPGADGQEAQKL